MKFLRLVIIVALSICIQRTSPKQSVYAYQAGNTKILSQIQISNATNNNPISSATFNKNTRFTPGTMKAKLNELYFNFGVSGENNNTIQYFRIDKGPELIDTMTIDHTKALPGSKIKLTDTNISIVPPSGLRTLQSKLSAGAKKLVKGKQKPARPLTIGAPITPTGTMPAARAVSSTQISVAQAEPTHASAVVAAPQSQETVPQQAILPTPSQNVVSSEEIVLNKVPEHIHLKAALVSKNLDDFLKRLGALYDRDEKNRYVFKKKLVADLMSEKLDTDLMKVPYVIGALENVKQNVGNDIDRYNRTEKEIQQLQPAYAAVYGSLHVDTPKVSNKYEVGLFTSKLSKVLHPW